VKRLPILLALFLLAAPAWAATKYIDSGCTNNGDGSAIDCASSGGGVGPWKTLQNVTWACSNTYKVRGVHATHGSNHAAGTTDGRYTTNDQISINIACASGTAAILEANGWTASGAATEEAVYIDGTDDPASFSGTWTACSGSAGSCNAPCAGLSASFACNTVWYVNPGGSMDLALYAQKPDGSMTPRMSTIGGIAAQYDSYSDEGGVNNLFVRWGATGSGTAPYESGNPKPYVVFNNNGFGIVLNSSSWLTIRGLWIRVTSRYHISLDSASNITIRDNHLWYGASKIASSGSDYGVASNGSANNVTIDHNDMAYLGSEGIHTQAVLSGATVFTITDNYIHDSADVSVMGPRALGSPSGMILGDHGGGSGNDNYTGSVVRGNFIARMGTGSFTGHGIILENASSNWVISDNVMDHIYDSCFRLESTGGNVNSNILFNNILSDCDYGGGGDGAAIRFRLSGANNLDGTQIYNNTIYAPTGNAINSDCSGGVARCSNTKIVNNILRQTNSSRAVDLDMTGTTTFTNNSASNTGTDPVIRIPVAGTPTTYTCANLNAGCSGNCSGSICNDPLFANLGSKDYHIQTSSPAKDAGTATGLPSGKTTDINNTITSAHSFPSYADNQAKAGSSWDIGADEYAAGSASNLTISKTDTPDPVVAGNNITYTLAYSNTGGADATGVVIRDTVPTNTTFVSATAGGSFGGGIVTWTLGTVIAGGSGTVQFVAQVASPLANGTVITNVGYSITSNEQGSIIGVSDTTTVTSLPFLILGKSDAPDPVLAGSNITYTIAYSNTGTAGATGVVITDTVPTNTTFVSATGGGTLGGGVVTWNIGAVNAGASATVQMVVTVGAGMASGSTITNQTYALASNELATVTGSPVTTSVTTASQSVAQYVLPITQRQNVWSATQTDIYGPQADIVQSPDTGQWVRGQASELLTLSTSGTTTDTSANLLPANAIIDAVVARVTTTITVATNWKLGDATQAGRFTAVQTGLTAGTTVVGLLHADPTVATANLGPVQAAAAKIRVTTTGTPSAGQIRVTVFYRQFVPPGS